MITGNDATVVIDAEIDIPNRLIAIQHSKYASDPNKTIPNPTIPSLCYIKNVVKNPSIIVGDYTYYDDKDGAERFKEHVTHFYPFIGDKLIIGKICAIARGNDELIDDLLKIKWWDWPIEKIEANFKALSSGDLSLIRKVDK